MADDTAPFRDSCFLWIFIPVRLDSRRLPNKPLLEARGKTLLEWTYEKARQVTPNVQILTSDDWVRECCEERGVKCVWRKPDRFVWSGTDRIAEYLRSWPFDEVPSWVVNWQVDEPLVNPDDIINMVRKCPGFVKTLRGGFRCCWEVKSPDTVKVVSVKESVCRWFSRAPMAGADAHCGVYVIHRDAILSWGEEIDSCPPYASAESLEQLAWIEQTDFEIYSHWIDKVPLSINTQNDWEQFVEIVAQEAMDV